MLTFYHEKKKREKKERKVSSNLIIHPIILLEVIVCLHIVWTIDGRRVIANCTRVINRARFELRFA